MGGTEVAKVAGLLLAAGGSSRFGSPKQLAEFEGESLIRRAAKTLIDSGCDPVMIVLGAEIERSAIHVADLMASTTINLDWESGISSSIRWGLAEIDAWRPDVSAILITLCDQPLIRAEKLAEFIRVFRDTGASLIAAEYGSALGVPALFAREMFGELSSLQGDKGARELIRTHPGNVGVPLGEAAFDVDRPQDLAGITLPRDS